MTRRALLEDLGPQSHVRIATFESAASPTFCAHKPYLRVSGYQRMEFISLNLRVRRSHARKSKVINQRKPFPLAYQAPGFMLPKDAKCTMNLVQQTNRRTTQVSRRLPNRLLLAQGTCITTSFMLDVWPTHF